MSDTAVVLCVLAVGLMVCGFCSFVGAKLATGKRRPAFEGALLGFLLGVIGLLIEALLPTRNAPRAKRRTPTVEHYQWKPMSETEKTVGDWLAPPRKEQP